MMKNTMVNWFEHHTDPDRLKTELDEQRKSSDVRPMELIGSLKLHKIPYDKWSKILDFDYDLPTTLGPARLLTNELLATCAKIVAAESKNGVFSISKESVQELEKYVARLTGVRVHPGVPPEKPWRLQQIGPDSEWREPKCLAPKIVWDLADAVYRFADEVRKAHSTYFRIVRSKLPSEGGPAMDDAFYLAVFFDESLATTVD